MKKTIITLFSIMLIFISQIYAQVPQALNYQAVARNAAGALLVNQLVGIRLTILQGSATGTVEYVETHVATTNQFGLFTLAIGTGTVVSGTFSTIPWSSGLYWLKTELDPTGGSSYTTMGTSQLLTVPFAMYAANAGTSGTTGATGPTGPAGSGNVSGTTNYVAKFTGPTAVGNSTIFDNGNIGIGTITPSSPLQVVSSGYNLADFKTTGTLDSRISFSTSSSIMGTVGWSPYNNTLNLTTSGADDISFGVNNLTQEVMRLTATGNVGIGTTKPTDNFDVVNNSSDTSTKFRVGIVPGGFYGFGQNYNTSSPSYMFGHGGSYWHIFYATTPTGTYTGLCSFDGPGNTFRPDIDNTLSLGTSGNRWTAVYAANGTIQTSDERYKTNITDIHYGLADVMKLRPISYQWKNEKLQVGTGTNLGFSAQAMEKIIPDVVVHSTVKPDAETGKMPSEYSDAYGVKYSELIPVLVKAIQEQQAEIEALKLQVKALQK